MSSKIKTKDLIIEIADRLFYQGGFEHTSFADIAEEVNISRGNFYHHFKTKDDILSAVISLRVERAKEVTRYWEEQFSNPVDRLKCFFSFFTVNREKIKKYGCPMGTLSNEMAKLSHDFKNDSVKVHEVFKGWLSLQFEKLDFDQAISDSYAMHLLSQSQGISTIYNAFEDERFVDREIQHIHQWLEKLL